MTSSATALGLGFTLLEMLVVLAIIGLMLAAIPEDVVGHISGVRVAKNASDIAELLRHARNDAVTRGVEREVGFDTMTRRCWSRDDGSVVALPADTALALKDIPTSLLRHGVGYIRFFADGSSTGGDITFRRGSAVFLIDVDWLTGRVILQR